MENLQSTPLRTSRLDSIERIRIYIRMRNITVPIQLTAIKSGVKMVFAFKNMPLEFKLTNLEEAYTEATQFIEEMNDEFLTTPKGEYTLYTAL